MSRAKRTVVLTSRENFVWLSMQEIIPFIEKTWLATAIRGKHEVVCRDVDRIPLAELMPELLAADNVVFTCFTVRLCKLGALLRREVGCDARYFIYLHNQATIACWPFHEWGMGAFLREDDVFISSSTPDARTMALSFEKCRVATVPFSIEGIRPSYRVPVSDPREIPFVYAGRLSVQKNLHTLIYAFRLLRDAHPDLRWRLTIYGTDDDLGSPNMGMRSKGYRESLRALVRLLGLEKRVVFKGYMKRARMNRELARKRHVAVSASLHSDENFGMAQFRSLCRGNLAVLTRWGGYADFGARFRGRALLAPAVETEAGPCVDPAEFAELLFRAAARYRGKAARATKVRVPRCYREKEIARSLLRLALRSPAPGPLLRMSALAKRIRAKRARFEKLVPGSSRIFESYADPDAKILFRGYRMARPGFRARRGRAAPQALRCFPWVSLGPRAIAVRDPHRGDLKLPHSEDGARRSVVVTDWFGQSRRTSRKTASRLLSLGYLHG